MSFTDLLTDLFPPKPGFTEDDVPDLRGKVSWACRRGVEGHGANKDMPPRNKRSTSSRGATRA